MYVPALLLQLILISRRSCFPFFVQVVQIGTACFSRQGHSSQQFKENDEVARPQPLFFGVSRNAKQLRLLRGNVPGVQCNALVHIGLGTTQWSGYGAGKVHPCNSYIPNARACLMSDFARISRQSVPNCDPTGRLSSRRDGPTAFVNINTKATEACQTNSEARPSLTLGKSNCHLEKVSRLSGSYGHRGLV